MAYVIADDKGRYYVADDEEFTADKARAAKYETKADAEADAKIVLRQWCWDTADGGWEEPTLTAVEA